jgi:membrane protease YdiL (CAAX protease family)
MSATSHPPPPAAPELPDGVQREPRWPWWFSLAGFGIALGATLVLGALLGVVALLLGGDIDETGPAITVGGALIQYVAFVGAAVGLAHLRLRPRAWHFGFRRTRFWPALGWSALAFFCFFVLSALYALVLDVDQEQTTLDDLGADESTLSLVIAAVLIIVIAPVAEEFFFRGFFYGSLRTSLPTWAAALIAGTLFGLTHVFTGVAAVPPLILFGVLLCLLYQQTGSLYPPIALHAFNNTISFMIGTEAIALSLALGAVTIASCVVVPHFAWRTAPVAS